MSFIRRVRQIMKKMGRIDSKRLDEASIHNQAKIAEHTTVHHTLGNMR